jgi:4-amino-4-deoxy-L-arabinose transferase-like glycosyltransferase
VPGLLEDRNRLALLALIAFCVVLFFTSLGSRALWDIDEGMHAAMAKEMV